MKVIVGMRKATQAAAVGIMLALSAVSAQAQQPSAGALAAAKELVATTGTATVFAPLVAGVVEQSKILFLQQNPALAKDLDEVAAKLKAEYGPKTAELDNEVARLYAVSFSEQELKDILAFYKGPAGQKLLKLQPGIIDNSMKFAQDWANKLSDTVIPRMRDEMKKKGHQL
jgi:hypothetical protein